MLRALFIAAALAVAAAGAARMDLEQVREWEEESAPARVPAAALPENGRHPPPPPQAQAAILAHVERNSPHPDAPAVAGVKAALAGGGSPDAARALLRALVDAETVGGVWEGAAEATTAAAARAAAPGAGRADKVALPAWLPRAGAAVRGEL